MPLFANKTVVVTGAGGGIGRSHALAFAAEGAQVVVNDTGQLRDGSGPPMGLAQQVVSEIESAGGRAIAHTHSIAERSGAVGLIETALSTFGSLDVLVNNAGILRDRTLKKMSDEEWDAVLAVHLKGTFLCTQAASAHMMAHGGGSIVNTTSTSGLIGNFGQGNYGAAKAGIAGLTRVAALEYAKYGIRVNAIAPTAKTRMTEDIDMVPAAFGPEHVSPLVLFLASSLASEVTGRIFGVHGGFIQEFVYMSSKGMTPQKGDTWDPREIASHFSTITNLTEGYPAIEMFKRLMERGHVG